MRYWYAIALFLFTGCGKDLLESDPINRGQLPLAPYVAIGGSETAGFADGALHYEAQLYSYPALISRQLQLVGGGAFNQPFTVDSNGFALVNGVLVSKLSLGSKTDCLGAESVVPVRMPSNTGTFASFSASSQAGPYGNLGIPFLRVTDLARPTLIGINPYVFRTGLDSVSYQQAVLNRAPKLFTIWLGMEEMLGSVINKVPAPAPVMLYNQLNPFLDSLSQDTTAAGFIATLPDVTAFPFFNTIPYNALELEQDLADLLNQVYAGTGMAFVAGPNAFVIEDANAPGGKRQIRPTEKLLLTLPLDSVKCEFMGSINPIPARYVVSDNELAALRDLLRGYNYFITQFAMDKGLTIVDLHGLYQRLESGLVVNGVEFSPTFVSGGFFSLDGLNPSYRGAAIIANTFIEVMNAEYRASVPTVSVVSQPGIRFP